MKFILCEDKFLLNENQGFILEERFILDEEVLLEAQATLKQLVIDLNKLDTLLPSLLEVLPVGTELKILDGTIIEDEKLAIEEKIKADCTEIQDLLSGKKNFKELIDKIRAKAGQPEGETFSEEEVKILQPLCYSIASDGISVKDRLKGIKSHKGELAEQVATLQERTPRLKTNIEELYKLFETDTPEEPPKEEPEEPAIKFSLKKSRVKLQQGKSFELKILATPKPTEAISATFTSEKPKIATVSSTGVVTAVASGATKIVVTVADQTLTCDVIVTDDRNADWEELYKKCADCVNRQEAFQAFWNGGLPKKDDENPKELPVVATDKLAAGYFQGEWGKNADRIRKLGTAFTDTLREFGWSYVLNPFIELLKHLCKYEYVVFDDASFSQLRAMYGSKISEADLRGKGKLGELNLVRNPLFYKKSGAEIADYLTWQYALLTSGKIPNESRLEVVYANISFDTGESLDINKILNDTRAYTAISEAKFIYEVRKLSKYKELIKSGFKIDGDKQKTIPATDEDIKEILTKVKSAEQSKKLITYLINLYRVIDLGLLKKLLADPIGEKIKTNRNTTSTTYEEDLKFDLIINTAIKKYSFEQLKTLCTKLIEIAKI
jgi:hypothetical protein